MISPSILPCSEVKEPNSDAVMDHYKLWPGSMYKVIHAYMQRTHNTVLSRTHTHTGVNCMVHQPRVSLITLLVDAQQKCIYNFDILLVI